MIVKNEEGVIRRCLESVKSHISYWVICDTGSKDRTQAIVREVLAGIPGDLYDDPWVDFGHNRTLAITRAKRKGEYHLLMNADETLHISGSVKDRLQADAYLVRFNGCIDFYLPLIVSDRHDWRYVGATHEYLHSDTAKSRVKLSGVSVTHHRDGGSRADKYERDLALLSKALDSEPDNARYMFYLAQTYRDMGLMAQAIEWYSKRATQGGWEEEIFISLYQIACLQQLSTLKWPVVMGSFLKAYQARPCRLEPLFRIAKFYRERQQYHLGYLFSRPVANAPYPEDVLFIERGVYEYLLPMEHAICCACLGQHDEAVQMYDRIIACPNTPPELLKAADHNRALSLAALEDKRLGSVSPVIKMPSSKNLVFTSAGDHSNLSRWLDGNGGFDLWITYYGSDENKYHDAANYYFARKGGKFPNLHFAYQSWPELFERYEAILVMDDDIVIDATGINRLFALREQHDLWLLQPAFDPIGKISHPITRAQPDSSLRFVNFVEVTCPLFSKPKLDEFMAVYDPALVGWGVDWWFLHVLGRDLKGRVAIVDEVTCINPHDAAKGGQREIDRLQPLQERMAAWQIIQAKWNIPANWHGMTEYGRIPKPRK